MRMLQIFFLAPVLSILMGQEWQSVGGDPGGMKYSPLDQINRIMSLSSRLPGTYKTGDKSDGEQPEPVGI